MKRNPFSGGMLALALLVSRSALSAADPLQIPLWPNGAPGSEARKAEKEVVGQHDRQTPIVYNIHNPSLTVYLPAPGTATGAALIVAPGGGHQFLSYIHEGTAVAEWLSRHGIAGFMLKYRLARDQAGNSPYKVEVDGLADAQRSIRLVRSRAAEWGVNPARIGFIGFSAGGELAMLATLHSDAGQAGAADLVEQQSSRPDFTVLGYPGIGKEGVITKDMPPAFMFSAYDDARTSTTIASLFLKYRAAGVPAEIHIFSKGGHGFGIRPGPLPVSRWPERLYDWMGERGFLRPSVGH
jgi:acetyl esterase/lipase